MDDKPRSQSDDLLDETIEESFPASDPPANTVETGIGIGEVAASDDIVVDNRRASRFEIGRASCRERVFGYV